VLSRDGMGGLGAGPHLADLARDVVRDSALRGALLRDREHLQLGGPARLCENLRRMVAEPDDGAARVLPALLGLLAQLPRRRHGLVRPRRSRLRLLAASATPSDGRGRAVAPIRTAMRFTLRKP